MVLKITIINNNNNNNDNDNVAVLYLINNNTISRCDGGVVYDGHWLETVNYVSP